MFPDDATLIARGKYSTLSRERREQLSRIAKIGTTIIGTANAILRDCEERPPSDGAPLAMLETCLGNLKAAREKLITLSLGMAELEPQAWGKDESEAA